MVIHAEGACCVCCSDVIQKVAKSVKAAASSIMPASKSQQDETVRPVRVVREESPDVLLRTAVQGVRSRMLLQCLST